MSNEDRLADLLIAWEDAAARGETPTPTEHCRDHPDLTAEFRHLLARLTPVNAVLSERADPLEHALTGRDLGRYRPLRFHARGGLGAVFVAEDSELRRTVALKCLQPLAAIDPEARRRFLAEAEITTRLEHPGVVPMYGLVEDARGTPYYAMRFVRGATLSDEIAKYHAAPTEVSFRGLLQNFVGVCKTAAYAHSRGVVHRDLKPDNVMIGPYGEALVLDWGLAKAPDAEPESESRLAATRSGALDTQLGTAKGTPAYMSPEQARGEWDRVGPPSDVFSLGGVLFAILTGRRPHDGPNAAAIIEKAKLGVVALARSLNPAVPRPLDAVCAKATAARPEDRYAGALELAQDVERWLAGEPVTAWREPLSVRARRWAKRHRTLVTTAAAVLLVGSVAVAVAGARLDRANQELKKRNDDLAAALKSEKEARELADDRRARMRGLLRESVAFAWWGPSVSGKGQEAGTLQLNFLASQYEAAVRADGGAADDLVFLDLHRSFGHVKPPPGEKKPELADVLARLTDIAAAEPDNDWVALWLGMARITLGERHVAARRFADARREFVAARDWLATSAARRRSEGPLALGHVTNKLYALSEQSKDVGRDELMTWLADARAAMGKEPPAGTLAEGLRDNWVFLRTQLSHYQLLLRTDFGRSPGAEAAFRAFAAEIFAERPSIRAAAEGTKMAILEARAMRYAAVLSDDLDLAQREIDLALGILALRIDHGANDAVFRDEFARAQVAYLLRSGQLLAASRKEKATPLPPERVAGMARGCIMILSDTNRTRDRATTFGPNFPKHTEESLRREWEEELKKLKGGK